MKVTVEVDSVGQLLAASGITKTKLAEAINGSVSLVSLRIHGKRAWFQQEIDILLELLAERGTTIARRRLVELIGRENIWRPRLSSMQPITRDRLVAAKGGDVSD